MEEVKVLELRILSVESNLDASLNLETNLCLGYNLCGIRYLERQPIWLSAPYYNLRNMILEMLYLWLELLDIKVEVSFF